MTKTVQRINHQLKAYYGQIVGQLLMVCCLLLTTVATAQVYPVKVTPQLIPPYSLKLSDYQNTSSEKLFVNILLTDTQDSGRQVRLKMYIEGQGLNIRTLDFVAGATPIFLDGGVNLRLSNLDLRPYFNLNNLLGITPQQYNQPLPDGRYDFCFEVYDQLSGQLLSQKRCTSVYLLLNDPPILNVPNRGDLVTAQNPQNIIFNWTPRHLNATGIQYEFTLKELWDTGLDPQAAFLASPPLHQETTFAPTLLYGPANIQLIEGKVYGWQVRALVSDGISETSVFRNNGFSEIYHFKYEGNCAPPQFILSEAQNSQTVEITWQYAPHIRYEIQYRKKGYGDADWFSLYAYNNQHSIHNLEAGTTYEFRVGGECTVNGGFAFSNIYEFTTPTEEETAYYNCGMPPDIEITNRTPLQNIGPNEVFTAADFPVVIGKVMGSNGNFSGWGYITIPFLEDLRTYIDLINELSQGKLNIGKYTRIKVSFNNIGINTDYQLISGFVVTEYDPDWKSIIDLDEAIDDIVGDDGEIDEFDATNIDISEVQVDDDGNIVLIDEDGNPHPIDVDTPVVITDENGDQWLVDKDGNVTELGEEAEGGALTDENTNGVSSSDDVTEISSEDVTVLFTPSGFYGTDLVRQDAQNGRFTDKYDRIPQASGGNYNVLYKAISNAPQPTDQLIANATFSNGKTADDIVFKTKQGTAVPATWNGNIATLTLEKQYDFAKDEILATVKPADSTENFDIAGKVNVWHLQQRQVNVTLVPVGTGTVNSAIADGLNAIYNPVGVHFNVMVDSPIAMDQNIWDGNGNGRLDIGDSSVLANYTAEERAIYNYYKAQRPVQGQMYYVFVLGNDIMTTDSSTEGFMPLKRQYGFVFNPNNAARAIAHELGHGVFGLEHPFTEYEIPQGSTDLLMDYGRGTAFAHMDWQTIHAPGLQLYLFQGDEEGESSFDPTDPLARIIAALADSGDLGLIKCKKCDDGREVQALDGYYRFTVFGQNYACLVATILNNDIEKLLAQNNLPTSAPSGIAPYYNLIREELAGKDNALYLFDRLGELTECAVKYPLPGTFCSEPDFDAPGIKEQLIEEIEQCVDDVLGRIEEKLLALKANFRGDQQAQFVHNGNVYRLNTSDEVEVVEDALTDTQIEHGEWTDEGIDQIFRVFENGNGILQFKAVGIRGNLSIFGEKTADLPTLSKNMKDKGNAFLLEFHVKDLNDTPQQKGTRLDSDAFADGKKIAIKEDVSFFKIISEGAGKMGTLLKTGEIEESTYLESTELTEVVHAPGLVTGSTEAATRAVTDITGVVVLVYDMSVDGKARQETLDGLSKVKDQIMEEPSTLFPLLTDIALEELTGNNKEAWEQSLNGATDSGKRGHVITKGSVRTAITVFTSGKLIASLPKMADELAAKLLDAKLWDKFKRAEGFTENMLQGFKKNLNELLEKIPEAAESLSKIADFSSAQELADLVAKMNKLKEVPGLNKVIADMGQYWSKFRGGIFQLDYAEQLLNSGKKISFEVSDLSDNLKRIYDITFEEVINGVPTLKKLELKNWNNFYPATIKSQLVKDLAKMKELGEIQWIFNKTDNITDLSKLKDNVLQALKKVDGSAVDELKELFKNPEMSSKIAKWMEVERATSNSFIEWLGKSENFDKIFEIVN